MTTYQTMRVTGHHRKKELHLLLDTGSTHNFIDANKALKMDCRVEKVEPMTVKVADGGQLICSKIIRNFSWRMQGVKFTADVMLLPLSGSDLVLGVHWFSQLGPVLWDFANLTMQFTHHGKKVHLGGIQKKWLKNIQSHKINILFQASGVLSMLQIIPVATKSDPQLMNMETSQHDDLNIGIQDLLEQYDEVFKEPSGLPPSREEFNHRIPLKEGTNAVNLRAYRYPNLQKNVIE